MYTCNKYLTRAPEFADHGAGHGRVNVGGVEDDERGVATEFQGTFV